MAYTTTEGRQELLDLLGQATEQLGRALGSLGEAYERLDEQTGILHRIEAAAGGEPMDDGHDEDRAGQRPGSAPRQ